MIIHSLSGVLLVCQEKLKDDQIKVRIYIYNHQSGLYYSADYLIIFRIIKIWIKRKFKFLNDSSSKGMG